MKLCLAPQLGQTSGSSSLSRRNRSWQSRQSTSGSVKFVRWPDASQTAGGDEDGGVEADDVVAQLHHRPPPRVLHVAQQQDAERAVVVGRAEAAVDLGRREHEAAPLAQVDDLVEQGRVGGRGFGHGRPVYGARTAVPNRFRPAPTARALRPQVGDGGGRTAPVTTYPFPAASPAPPTAATADPTAVMGRRIGAFVIDLLLYLLVIAFVGPTPLSPLAEYFEAPDSLSCDTVYDSDDDVVGCADLGDRVYFTTTGDLRHPDRCVAGVRRPVRGVAGRHGADPGQGRVRAEGGERAAAAIPGSAGASPARCCGSSTASRAASRWSGSSPASPPRGTGASATWRPRRSWSTRPTADPCWCPASRPRRHLPYGAPPRPRRTVGCAAGRRRGPAHLGRSGPAAGAVGRAALGWLPAAGCGRPTGRRRSPVRAQPAGSLRPPGAAPGAPVVHPCGRRRDPPRPAGRRSWRRRPPARPPPPLPSDAPPSTATPAGAPTAQAAPGEGPRRRGPSWRGHPDVPRPDPGGRQPAPQPPTQPTPAAQPAPQPPAQPAATGYNPQWDAARGTYIVWEPQRGQWLGWDDATRQWRPL